MTKKRIGALIIGQSPRPDLVAPLERLLPGVEILQAGALDGLTPDDLPDAADALYPLSTRMRSGELVMVGESFIAPRLQHALARVEAMGAAAAILLCAGTFADLQGTKPLFKPFEIGAAVLRALNLRSVGLITPVAGQEAPIHHRWETAGFQPVVWMADMETQDGAFHQRLNEYVQQYQLECIVLDYVGHPVEQVRRLQAAVNLPVVDLGGLAMVTLASTLGGAGKEMLV